MIFFFYMVKILIVSIVQNNWPIKVFDHLIHSENKKNICT